MTLEHAIWMVLGAGVLPLWLAAGAADWACHRRTHIELTSGARESALHVLLHLLIAAPVLLAFWFEINATLLVLMVVSVLAHTVVAWRDTAFSQPRRHIAPFEQLVHSV